MYGLKRRLKRERKKKWTESNNKLVNEAQAKVDEFKKEKDVVGNDQSEEEKAKTAKMLEDLELRVEQLRDLSDSTWEDLGPIYDCVVFHDGTNFRAVVDVSESGKLADLPCLTDYHKEHQFSTFIYVLNGFFQGKKYKFINKFLRKLNYSNPKAFLLPCAIIEKIIAGIPNKAQIMKNS